MSTLLLLVYPIALILGGMLLGWLARWYRYGGRCGPRGLMSDGVPNIDAERGTVALDGTEPVKNAGTRRAKAAEDARAALGSLRAGYSGGKRTDAPGAAVDGSPAARVGSLAGNAVAAAASVGRGVAAASASASTSIRETGSDAVASISRTASGAVDGTKSGLASMKEGHAEGKAAPDDRPDAPADGTVSTTTGAASGDAATGAATGPKAATASLHDSTVSDRVVETTNDTVPTTKGTVSGMVDGSKSGVETVRDGYAEGKTPGGTPDAPADGSVVAKLGAVVGGAVASVKGAAAGAAESAKSAVEPLRDGTVKGRVMDATNSAVSSVKGTASDAADGTKSGLAAMKDGYAEGKTPGGTPDAPADGSVVAKLGAVVGGAVASVKGTAASVAESAKSAVEPLRDGTAKERTPDATGDATRPAKDTASGAARGTRPDLETTKEAPAGNKASDSPADGSSPSRAGAVVGGAVAATVGAAKAAVSPKEDATDTADEAARNAARHDRGLPGATIGQEDGTIHIADDPVPARPTPASGSVGLSDASTGSDPAVLRARFAALADEAAGSTVADDTLPAALDDIEEEARRLIESGVDIGKPGSALAAPARGRAPDDLKRISGVGPKIERTLNDEGIYYFDQIAGFDGRDLAWADRTLGFHGRVVRDRWMPQARRLAEEKDAAAATPVGYRTAEGASGNAPVNTPLRLAEAEALRLIEREGGYAATSQNRPDVLMRDGPVGGRKDDLKRIKGVGDKLERVLNGLGVYYFRQIAAFSATDIAWVDSKLKFKGRIIRDRWVPQAAMFEQNRDI